MNDLIESLNHTKWRRKLLKLYWTLIAIFVFGEIISISIMIFEDQEILNYLLQIFLPPLAVMIISVLLLEWLCKSIEKGLDYMFISLGSIMSGTIVFVNASMPIVQACILLPIGLSLLYAEKIKVVYATLINLFVASLLYYHFTDMPWNSNIAYISILMILICSGFIGLIIIERGKELQQQLEQSLRKEMELRARSELLDSLARQDALTELPNHKSFHEHMDKLIQQFEFGDKKLQLALIDIDNFKYVNDNYGHWVGDIVLKRVALQLKIIVDDGGFASRYGGEEFAIILQEEFEEKAFKKLEEIRTSIASLSHPELIEGSITVSIGLHTLQYNETKEALFKKSDQALYEAKREGKNKTVVA